MSEVTARDSARLSRLCERLRLGDGSAETLVVRRFTVQLVSLARRQLAASIRRKSPPEDVVQSVFRSFFARVRRGQFELANWERLWSLLVLITLRKCAGRR